MAAGRVAARRPASDGPADARCSISCAHPAPRDPFTHACWDVQTLGDLSLLLARPMALVCGKALHHTPGRPLRALAAPRRAAAASAGGPPPRERRRQRQQAEPDARQPTPASSAAPAGRLLFLAQAALGTAAAAVVTAWNVVAGASPLVVAAEVAVDAGELRGALLVWLPACHLCMTQARRSTPFPRQWALPPWTRHPMRC